MSNREPQAGVQQFFGMYKVYESRAKARTDEWANIYGGDDFHHDQRVVIEFMMDLLKRVDNLETIMNVKDPEKAALVAQLSKK